MKQTSSLLIILASLFTQLRGQPNTNSAYNNLEIVKHYNVNLSSRTGGGIAVYKVNGRQVNKQTYDKYKSTSKSWSSCCPCILKLYDEKENLLRESVSCTDCGVGWFKTYHENGNLKLTGSYMENTSGDWKNIYYAGYCNKPNGQWTYFNEKGDTLYSEFWANGEFLKQVPEQRNAEIWDIDLTLNGKVIDTQTIAFDQIQDLKIIPKYKNNNKDTKLTITLEVSATGYESNEKQFTVESFKYIDVASMISEAGIPNDTKSTFWLTIYSDDQAFRGYTLNVKR